MVGVSICVNMHACTVSMATPKQIGRLFHKIFLREIFIFCQSKVSHYMVCQQTSLHVHVFIRHDSTHKLLQYIMDQVLRTNELTNGVHRINILWSDTHIYKKLSPGKVVLCIIYPIALMFVKSPTNQDQECLRKLSYKS